MKKLTTIKVRIKTDKIQVNYSQHKKNDSMLLSY